MKVNQPGNKQGTKTVDTFLDEDWAKKAFIVKDIDLEDVDRKNRYWSSASSKFTDTSLGGNIGINTRPGFTPYADIPVKGRLPGRDDLDIRDHQSNYGLGRYYSDALDESAQVIYMRFGVPEFNTLTNFLRHAYDPTMISIARTGKGPSVFYNIGEALGSIALYAAFPTIAVTIAAIRTAKFFFARPMHKFYTFKETMHTYWTAVNTLVNAHAINMGIFPKIFNDMAQATKISDANESQKINQPFKLDSEYIKALTAAMPDVFHGNSLFDVYNIANKAQRLANREFMADYEALNNGTATDYLGYVKKMMTGTQLNPTYISDSKGKPTLSARLKFVLGKRVEVKDDPKNSDAATVDYKVDPAKEDDTSWWDTYAETVAAAWDDGSMFAAFRVENTGQVQESFSSSVVESELSSKLNGISSQVRDMRFSVMDGNIMGGLGDMVSGIVGAGVDLAMGAASGVTGGLSNVVAGLAGSGFIDIPKHWQSSNVQLPRPSYRMKLVTPYHNPISEMMNIWIPYYMLLAGTLPLSTGKASYTAPFLCQVFDRGRCQVRLGMIESVSTTRGITNVPFTKDGRCLGLEVSFNIVDLSSIMHMPVGTGPLDSINATLDEDNILADYIAVLAGQDLNSQIYAMPKAKLKAAALVVGASALTSPSRWGMITGEFVKGIPVVGSAIEGISRGTNLSNRTGV